MFTSLKNIRIPTIIVITLLAMLQPSIAFAYTLEISESQLQDKISAMMPMQRKNVFVSVTLSDPKVDLLSESNEIGLFSNIEVIALGSLKGSGRATISGSLKYETEKGEFYIQNPKVLSLEVDNVDKAFIPKIKNFVQHALTQTMATYPVYKFNEDDIQQRFAKAALKSVVVEQEKLLVTLSLF